MQSDNELTYDDFEVEIGYGKEREYPITVIRSPAGEAHETMHFPFDKLALESRLKNLKIALLQSGGKRHLALSQEEQTVQEFGKNLWDALLTGEVRSRYDVSMRKAEQQGKGLRLKLRIQPPELAALPWEFLYDSRQADYFSLSKRTPLVRYLKLPKPIRPLTLEGPLHILGMVASPSDLPPLDVTSEKQRVVDAIKNLQDRGLVDIKWLEGETWHDLQQAMRNGTWHVFHFIGHGGFDRNTDEGLIALKDEKDGQMYRLSATELGHLLADHDSLRLVLLNSCEGAKGGERDIFSSTAAILVRKGIPAVLAMQYKITDTAAIEFSRSFYEALADRMPVDAAVAEARIAVSMAVTNTIEWGTPVLYMCSPDGVLFNILKKSKWQEANGIERLEKKRDKEVRYTEAERPLYLAKEKDRQQLEEQKWKEREERDRLLKQWEEGNVESFPEQVPEPEEESESNPETGEIVQPEVSETEKSGQPEIEAETHIQERKKTSYIKRKKEPDIKKKETIFNKIKKIFGKIKKDEIKISPVKKIADIDFSSSINLNKKYPLIVRLLNDKADKVPEGRIVILGYAKGIEEIKIIVTLDAKDFEIENSEQEMKVPLMKDSKTLVFYLTPKSTGKKKIRLKFYQDENYNGEIFIETTVYKQESIEEAHVKVVPHGEVGIHIDKQKAEDLRIEAEIDNDYLEYKVTSRILGLFNKKCRIQERLHEPRLFVNKTLKELSDISSATYSEDEKYKRIISKIETVGMDLYKRLIPEELKQILWNNKDKIDSIFIVTDEEWIPWEIIKSYRITEDGDMEKDDFWGMKYVIGRWLSGHFPWEQIFVQKSVVIANDYNGKLKYVMKEKENIEKIFRSKNVEILSIRPGRLETLDLLSDKVINLLHFACDSTYDELYPDDSYIKLSDDELKAKDIGVKNLRKGKPLIFMNACQSGRADYAFSGVGGFAKAFLDVGALAFIGTIWKIPDELSMRFSEEFYRNVFEKNMSLGESLRETKQKFSTLKNPAWLSYSLYSFPLAEITV